MDVNRVYKPTYNWGAPSCIGKHGKQPIDDTDLTMKNADVTMKH
jgi:hypothetical protein